MPLAVAGVDAPRAGAAATAAPPPPPPLLAAAAAFIATGIGELSIAVASSSSSSPTPPRKDRAALMVLGERGGAACGC